jgi:hypothetical protein
MGDRDLGMAAHRSQASLRRNEVASKIGLERMKASLKVQSKRAETTFEVERDEQSGWLVYDLYGLTEDEIKIVKGEDEAPPPPLALSPILPTPWWSCT